MKFLFGLLVFTPCFSSITWAAKVHGRASFGTMAATERFSDSNTASNKNDFMISSARYYTKVTEINNSYLGFVADFRDKNDFFDKLNREKLQLDNKNEFQVRQLFALHQIGKMNFNLGRFPVLDAGSVYTDGLLIGYKLGSSWNTAIFGGLNPKRVDQTYVQWNPTSQISGTYLTYQNKLGGWDRNLFSTSAFVNQTTNGETDRTYFYNSTGFQWQLNSRILTLLYLDFAPRTNVQIGSLYWRQVILPTLLSQFNLLGIDVIEYTRKQDVRERLPPSPYREASLKLDYAQNSNDTFELGFLGGRREFDQKTKSQAHLGLLKNRVFGPKWDSSFKIGGRHNFTSDDNFAHISLGYFSRLWEGQLDLEYANEKYEDGKSLQPVTTEVSCSYYFSKSIYGSLSFMRAADQEVEILSGYVRLSYRWGTQDIPPVRDGAPPRGTL